MHGDSGPAGSLPVGASLHRKLRLRPHRHAPRSVFTSNRSRGAGHLRDVLGEGRFSFPKDHEVLWFRVALAVAHTVAPYSTSGRRAAAGRLAPSSATKPSSTMTPPGSSASMLRSTASGDPEQSTAPSTLDVVAIPQSLRGRRRLGTDARAPGTVACCAVGRVRGLAARRNRIEAIGSNDRWGGRLASRLFLG